MAILNRGDHIGFVASSNPITLELKKSFNVARKFFTDNGLVPILGKYCFREEGGWKKDMPYPPESRAKDIERFARDFSIKAIVNLWGGYNSIELLNLMQWHTLGRSDKIIIGASDFTVFLNAAIRKKIKNTFLWINAVWLGLEVYQPSRVSFQKFFLGEQPSPSLLNLARPAILRRGKEKGMLIGGNLESFERLIGTPFFPNCKDAILVLEAANSPILQVRAMLEHLRLGGVFSHCRGLVVGHFEDRQPEKNNQLQRMVNQTILNFTKKTHCPIIATHRVGHEVGNEVLPLGERVFLDTTRPNFLFRS